MGAGALELGIAMAAREAAFTRSTATTTATPRAGLGSETHFAQAPGAGRQRARQSRLMGPPGLG